MRFKNNIIIITGASSGIGAATAKLFSKEGAIVYNLDNTKPKYSYHNVHWIGCDVTNFIATQSVVAKIIAQSKRIDCLFANAGIYFEAPFIEKTLEIINQTIAVNLLGTIHTLKIILPIMDKQKFGNIVLMGSDQSFVGRENSAIYSATKGAILQLAKSLAIEHAKNNIRVNCVCPGAIVTQLMQKAVKLQAKREKVSPKIIYKNIKKTIPINRLGRPKEVANVVAFLCSKESSLITGAVISIDGGVVAATTAGSNI